ncbi:hypothetical protein HDF18_13080 [Mucilaginibacter sp. X5P1]|uniref:hypothetical protein n=1 Tax=Mucilaginibacter sp. X5P1 TaxID=2723088 RepID=UPI0016189401|nr:hypothetical protein [Mucilaginibacter sp. X5P1]MBB6141728.1 hypothetical protein [Mucilaginibacter sp. X5P1]
MKANVNLEMKSSLITSTNVVTLETDPTSSVSFDLQKVKMTSEQHKIVIKLFSQNPSMIAADEEHSPADEQGKEGPGSKYLSRDEFESIRTLGVRLGPVTNQPLAVIADFCIHAIILPKLK